MALEYKASGHWIPTDGRDEMFASRAAAVAGITTAEVFARLAAGEELAFDRPYDKLRDASVVRPGLDAGWFARAEADARRVE